MRIDVELKGDVRRSARIDLARIHAAASYALRASVSEWIRRAAGTRHNSAHRLGAAPTGHLEDAAATVTNESSSTGGRVIVSSPGFGRVFRSLSIRPRRARALTIPLHKYAYGNTVREMRFRGWQIFRPRRARVLMGIGPGESTPVPLFALCGGVTIPQDRGLLPPDDEMQAVCSTAAMGVLEAMQ